MGTRIIPAPRPDRAVVWPWAIELDSDTGGASAPAVSIEVPTTALYAVRYFVTVTSDGADLTQLGVLLDPVLDAVGGSSPVEVAGTAVSWVLDAAVMIEAGTIEVTAQAATAAAATVTHVGAFVIEPAKLGGGIAWG